MVKKECCEANPFVKIAGCIAGILLVIIIVFIIFAKEMLASTIGTIVWGFVVLGIVLGLFASRAQKKK